ncbi:MAG: hypothetical protein K8R39_03925 [Arcobacteraceae bacterium]|nr:hypothetical protein [Arcobacteraceae bacterium]
MIEKAMNYAKNPVEEKIGFSFQLPVSMKKEFEQVCKLNDVTMTNMLLGLIKATNDENPTYNNLTKEQLEIEEITLEHKLENTKNHLESIADNEFEDEELCNIKSSLYTKIRFLNNQLEKVRKELY